MSNKFAPSFNRSPQVKSSHITAVLRNARGLAELHASVIEPLNRIIDQTGGLHDWTMVVHRIYVGAVTSDQYFTRSHELNEVFNMAHTAMQTVMLRMQCNNQFGLLVNELDKVLLALDTTHRMMQKMQPAEVAQVYKLTDGLLEHMVLKNMQSYPEDAFTPEHWTKLTERWESLQGETV